MKKNIRVLLNCILLAALALGLFMTVRQLADKSSAGDSYAEAARIATGTQPAATPETLPAETAAPTVPETIPPETTAPAETEPVYTWVPAPVEEEDPELEKLASIDLNALREVNPDVIGWIRIPETRIDYPILQGEDNDYYLNHTWQNNRNIAGSIFMEQMCTPDFTDYNTILYGHNMQNGSMFAGILKYQKVNYYKTHPYIYLVTDEGVFRYEVFAAYRAALDSRAYSLSIQEDASKERFLNAALESDETDNPITPPITDRILTLSSCYGGSGTRRFVVHARLPMVEVAVTGQA